MRAALIIDHVEMMSRMMETCDDFGHGNMEEDDEEEYEYGDGDGNKDNVGNVIEEVVKGDLAASVVEHASGYLEVKKDENDGSGREEGGDGDRDKDEASDGEE